MKDFFYAIIIIFVVVFFIVVYYVTRDLLQKRVIKYMKIRIREKRYTDQKYYLYSYLTHYLSYLEKGDVFWISVFSRQYPFLQIQISYDIILNTVNIIGPVEELGDKGEHKLLSAGALQLKKEDEIFILSAKPDPGHIVHIIFLIFEMVHKQKFNLNLKISAS